MEKNLFVIRTQNSVIEGSNLKPKIILDQPASQNQLSDQQAIRHIMPFYSKKSVLSKKMIFIKKMIILEKTKTLQINPNSVK